MAVPGSTLGQIDLATQLKGRVIEIDAHGNRPGLPAVKITLRKRDGKPFNDTPFLTRPNGDFEISLTVLDAFNLNGGSIEFVKDDYVGRPETRPLTDLSKALPAVGMMRTSMTAQHYGDALRQIALLPAGSQRHAFLSTVASLPEDDRLNVLSAAQALGDGALLGEIKTAEEGVLAKQEFAAELNKFKFDKLYTQPNYPSPGQVFVWGWVDSPQRFKELQALGQSHGRVVIDAGVARDPHMAAKK